MILDAKSNLAKLMATENIIVEQKKAPTAHFNLETRTLVIPILKQELSNDLYDLFIGHEVGHALNTPSEGWHDSIIDCGVNRSILNVCEDVRIEKMIRRKFPGLKASFVRAYKELMGMDFFGIKEHDVDIATLNLIDRINLHTKCGISLGVTFNQEEAELLREAEATETWEEVVIVAKKIQAYMKQKRKQEVEANAPEKMDGNPQRADSEDDGEEQEFGESDSVPGGSHSDYEYEEEEIESETDNAFRDQEQRLYDDSNRDLRYGNIPSLKSEEFIVDYKDLYKRVRSLSEKYETKFDTGLYSSFRQSTTKVVAYLVKEFELRKNADQLKRASIAKTGDLNPNRLYAYQMADDIFKKMTIMPDGKSHGLVLFLDWSGSMSDYLQDTVKQLLTLVLFCKSVNIPFEVYSFNSHYNKTGAERFDNNVSHKITYKVGDIKFETDCWLLNVLSSRMSKADFTYAASALLDCNKLRRLDEFMLGSTPLNECIMLAMDLIPKFKARNKLQVVNTVFLTDGEGHCLVNTVGEETRDRWNQGSKRLIIRDPKTHVSVKADYQTNETSSGFLHIFKQRTGTNVIGFRIIRRRQFNDLMWRLTKGDMRTRDEMSQSFTKEKSVGIQAFGYDQFFLLRSDTMDTEEEEFEVKSTTTRGLVSAFKKYTKGNIGNRVVLNRFIGLIS